MLSSDKIQFSREWQYQGVGSIVVRKAFPKTGEGGPLAVDEDDQNLNKLNREASVSRLLSMVKKC
jgi:hypothetical protein